MSVKKYQGTKLIFGKNCAVRGNVVFWGGGIIKFGDNVTISSNSHICSSKEAGVEFGNDVLCATNLYIVDLDHGTRAGEVIRNQKEFKHGKVIIKDGVWIGHQVTILKGVTIGEGAVIGAGAVVSKNCEPNGIYGGNPAKLVKYRE